jgi:hypothetical protein
MRSVFRTIGTGALNKSQEVAWLKTERWRSVAAASTVVERREASAPQGARRAREGAEVVAQRFSAFRFPSSLRGAFATKQSRLCAADPGLLRRFAPRDDEVSARDRDGRRPHRRRRLTKITFGFLIVCLVRA